MTDPVHLAGPDGRGSDCGISFARSPRTTFITADVSCQECRELVALRRRHLLAADRSVGAVPPEAGAAVHADPPPRSAAPALEILGG